MLTQEQLPIQEIPGVPHTAVTDLIEQDAQLHPEAWSGQTLPLFGQKGRVALYPDAIGVAYVHDDERLAEFGDYFEGRSESDPPEQGETVYAKPTSSKAWLVNVYGSRWGQTPEGRTILQTTLLERLPEIHSAIAETILTDEHSRTAFFVDHAEQKFGKFTKDDITIWLEAVRSGHSPIMATGEFDSDGSRKYITHDYTDWHTASNLLWGREIQDRITIAAGYELERRQVESPALEERQPDGVSVIDAATCSKQQIDILDYAMHGPGVSPKERIAAAWSAMNAIEYFTTGSDEAYEAAKPIYAKWQADQYLDPEVAAVNIHDLGRTVGNLEDFIQWYEHGGNRRATDEEKASTLKEALIGITRVAEKLLGVYDGTELVLPEQTIDPVNDGYDNMDATATYVDEKAVPMLLQSAQQEDAAEDERPGLIAKQDGREDGKYSDMLPGGNESEPAPEDTQAKKSRRLTRVTRGLGRLARNRNS